MTQAEHIAEVAEDIREVAIMGKVRPVKAAGPLKGAAQAFMAKLVVGAPFLGIAQHLIGLGDLFEFLLRLFMVFGVPVWMIFQGHPAVGPFDLIGSSPFVYAQYIVIIPFHNFVCRYASKPVSLFNWLTG